MHTRFEATADLSSRRDIFRVFGWKLIEGEATRAPPRSKDCQTFQEASSEQMDICWDTANKTVAVRFLEGYCEATAAHLLLDVLLPRLLARDGYLVVHGALVHLPIGALGFIAPSGYGKSTLTGSLHRLGLPLMSDDGMLLLPDREHYRAQRLYPSLRLFPDALSQIFPAAEETSLFAEYSDKRRVPFDAGPDAAPLVALFRLAGPASDLRVTRLAPAEACMAIITNSFAHDPTDPIETQRRFAQATDVARRVPVYDLHYPREYSVLQQVYAKIFATIGWPLPEESAA